MGKGIVKLDYLTTAQFFIDGKRAEDMKSILMLPENYTVDHMHNENSSYLSIVVSSPDIPEVSEGDLYPTVELVCVFDLVEDGKYKPSLQRIKISPLGDYTVGEKPEVLLADRMLKEMDLELRKKDERR